MMLSSLGNLELVQCKCKKEIGQFVFGIAARLGTPSGWLSDDATVRDGLALTAGAWLGWC